jgi:hypothetical protein
LEKVAESRMRLRGRFRGASAYRFLYINLSAEISISTDKFFILGPWLNFILL